MDEWCGGGLFCCIACRRSTGGASVFLQVWCAGNFGVATHADEEFEADLTGFEDGGFDGTGIAGDAEDDFIGVARADARGHVTGNVDSRCFHCGVRHDETDRSRRASHEAEGLPRYSVEGFLQGCACAGGKCKFKMSGVTDVQFSGISLREFKCELDRMTHVGDIITANYDIVAVAAPAFGVSWEFDGEDFGVGGFDCVVYCGDLTGGSGPGAEEPQGVVFGADIHGFQEGVIYAGDDEADGVEDGGADEFGAGAVGTDTVYVYHSRISFRPPLAGEFCVLFII